MYCVYIHVIHIPSELYNTRQMIIIVGASVSDMVMVIIIRKFLKFVVRGASVHVARRQLTLGVHSRCDSHVGSSTGTKSNRSLGVQEFQLRDGHSRLLRRRSFLSIHKEKLQLRCSKRCIRACAQSTP